MAKVRTVTQTARFKGDRNEENRNQGMRGEEIEAFFQLRMNFLPASEMTITSYLGSVRVPDCLCGIKSNPL